MDWGYVAGYFDGEGHVSMHQQRTRRGMTTVLMWTNTHQASLAAMQQFMGAGRIYCRSDKPVYNLHVTRRADLLRVLKHMIPHLIVKKEQAIALRDYLLATPFRATSAENFGKVAKTSTEQLTRWYNDEGLSLYAIAKKLGVHTAAVAQAFRVRGLARRPAGGSHMKGVRKSDETRRRMSAAAVLRETARREARATA